MEYNLLKTIEPNLSPIVSSSTYPRLTPYPAIDFVNPGLGQIGRLYSFYVPVHSAKSLHNIEKKVPTKVENLEGSGTDVAQGQTTEQNLSDDNETTECIII